MTFLHPRGLNSINPKDAPGSLVDLEISAPDDAKKIFPALDGLGIFLYPWNNPREGSRKWNSAVSSMQGQGWISIVDSPPFQTHKSVGNNDSLN